MYRILVTGSRDWKDKNFVALKIFNVILDNNLAFRDVVIVHGDCPTGADAMAQEFADKFHIATERHPADWKCYDRKAGPVRNKEMVRLGADIVLAFPLGESRGTRGCMKLAKEAGLNVINCGEKP
jgi:hypothetical protein